MFQKKEVKDYLEHKAEDVLDRLEKTPAQKLIVAILIVASVSVLSVGYLQIKSQLERPFFADKLIEDKAKIRGPREFLDFYISEQRNRSDLVRLQQLDSDQDGLTDYQELYIYKTNQYSADTDSDGVNDGQEVNKGTDPRCPVGSACDAEGFIVSSSSQFGSNENVNSTQNYPVATTDTSEGSTLDSLSSSGQDVNLSGIISGTPGSLGQLQNFTSDEKIGLTTYFSNLQPSEVRILLLQQGFPKDQVDTLTDADLKSVLNNILNSL